MSVAQHQTAERAAAAAERGPTGLTASRRSACSAPSAHSPGRSSLDAADPSTATYRATPGTCRTAPRARRVAARCSCASATLTRTASTGRPGSTTGGTGATTRADRAALRRAGSTGVAAQTSSTWTVAEGGVVLRYGATRGQHNERSADNKGNLAEVAFAFSNGLSRHGSVLDEVVDVHVDGAGFRRDARRAVGPVSDGLAD